MVELLNWIANKVGTSSILEHFARELVRFFILHRRDIMSPRRYSKAIRLIKLLQKLYYR